MSRANRQVRGRSLWARYRLVALLVVLTLFATLAIIVGQIGNQSADRKNDNVVFVDLDSKVGQHALSFTLSDSEGTEFTVEPGRTGRPIVIVFHMGSI